MWTAVFKSGTHTDSEGRTRHWSDEDLDRIASRYDPARHEAPVVIGHPRDNAPAWGWVEGLKREGGLLFAKLRLVPEFAEMLRKGLFRKRSISLYPDMGLRHIGFLGAAAPAVKGLPDVSFSAGEDATGVEVEFKGKEAKEMNGFIERLKKFLKEELGIETADLRQKEKELADRQGALRKAEAAAFCEGLLKEGRVTPAMLKQGLPGFIEVVSGIQTSHEFAGGEEARSPLDFLKGFLKALPVCVSYQEHTPAQEEPDEKRKRLISRYMEDHGRHTYRDALIAVSKEHPELF